MVSGWTEDEKRRFVISDNGSWGEWDQDILANMWSDLPLIEWGVKLPEDWGKGIPEENKQIDEDSMSDTKNECPKCGFKW